MQNVTNYGVIPDPFLFLIREPAIQAELSLSPQQKTQLVQLNEQHDGKLLASRNVPPAKSDPIVAEVFAKSREATAKFLSPQQLQRLQQITFRMKGISFVLLPEAARELALTPEQREQITQVVEQTRKQLTVLTPETYPGPEESAKAELASQKIREKEQQDIVALLSSDQQTTLVSLVGKPFDLSQLGHVTFRAPDLAPVETWIHSEALNLAQLRGKVVVLHFFAFGCINCIHNYPWYRDWNDTFAGKGLVTIGIHTPETSAEHDVAELRRRLESEKLTFPVLADNDQRNWNAWGNSMWPSVYLIDKQGRLRYWWYGELDWNGAGGQNIMKKKIEQLLAEEA